MSDYTFREKNKTFRAGIPTEKDSCFIIMRRGAQRKPLLAQRAPRAAKTGKINHTGSAETWRRMKTEKQK